MGEAVAIKVDHVNKTFRLPHEKTSSIKSAVVNFYRRDRNYELQEALKNISFEIKKGEFFAIVGKNGSGKSTLLKILAGTYAPSSGSVQVNGKLTPFIELGVGFNQELSGRENVFLNGALLGFSRKEMAAMYQDIVNFAELERFMDQKLKNYSSGMQVRLAFSIAIRAKSDILLLDEVLAVGDAAFQQKCYDYFEELKRLNKTVVFVSHDVGAVRRFCSKAVYLNNGKLISQGSPADIADLYTEYNIEAAEGAKPANGQPSSKEHDITLEVVGQKGNQVELSVKYASKDNEELYVGISVIKDGISIAEINTLPDLTFKGKGALAYTLDTGPFNSGAYHVTAALFHVKNKKLLTFTSDKARFAIKGSDYTRGAALKLQNTWRRSV